jgi:hypothetical protein
MPRCPKCSRHFGTSIQVARHLAQPLSLCARIQRASAAELVSIPLRTTLNSDVLPASAASGDPPVGDEFNIQAFDDIQPAVQSQGPPQSPHSDNLFCHTFPGAAQAYGVGPTFMDNFDIDRHARERRDNLYYPFASRQDWEVAEFLLSSGMSMARIDRFLHLDSVCISVSRAVRVLWRSLTFTG